MSHHRGPIYLTLRVWASKLERGLLTPAEAQSVAMLLRRIADGKSIDEALGVESSAHRPDRDTTLMYVSEVYRLLQPSWKGKPSITVGDAITKTAAAHHVSIETVRNAYYSKKGQIFRDAMEYRQSAPPSSTPHV